MPQCPFRNIRRVPENRNTKTFDFVRVHMGLKTKDSCPDRNELIRTYRQDLVKIALIKIAEAKRFQKYGVPINFLKASKMSITCSNELEILFELKDLGKRAGFRK